MGVSARGVENPPSAAVNISRARTPPRIPPPPPTCAADTIALSRSRGGAPLRDTALVQQSEGGEAATLIYVNTLHGGCGAGLTVPCGSCGVRCTVQ